MISQFLAVILFYENPSTRRLNLLNSLDSDEGD